MSRLTCKRCKNESICAVCPNNICTTGCHASCSKCVGPSRFQCLECADSSKLLVNGECIKCHVTC